MGRSIYVQKLHQNQTGDHYASSKIWLWIKGDSICNPDFQGFYFFSLAWQALLQTPRNRQWGWEGIIKKGCRDTHIHGKVSIELTVACSLLLSQSRNPSICYVLFIIFALHQEGNIHTEPRGLKSEALEKSVHIRHIQLFSIPTPHTCFYLLFLGQIRQGSFFSL